MALVAFGLKAGVFPLHVWLPSAHANAPSHVSAILSAVLLKVGIYGLVRVCSLFPTPPFWWGTGRGARRGILCAGVGFAIGSTPQAALGLPPHREHRHHLLGLGWPFGRSTGSAEWVFLGLAGCLLHVWNHGLFKAALFYAAGNVIHATHTRTIDALGGLAKRMPLTSLAFLLSAVAICGLPPLNGFISEFLVYLGLFKTLPAREASVVGMWHPSPWL
jgi:hydrogenase-4 component B